MAKQLLQIPVYKELLGKSEQERSQEEVLLDIERAKNQTNADLIETKNNRIDLVKTLNLRYSAKYPNFSAASIVETRLKIKACDEAIEELEAVLKGMFE